ncbi:MAG: hypothetical protein M1342_01705 [Patescibacteria group bacterium]|nr:hypothetical protein [Patescibacteria group bacterium]
MIKAHAQADRFPLAGFDFTIADLGEIGALARYLAEKGQIGGCIDERLATRTAEGDSGVHERCGAAGLIASNIGGQGTAIEDMALQALPQFNGQKASLIPGTEGGHESITVLTDLTGQGTALPAAQLTGARTVGALPFTASISVRNILDFAQQNGGQLSDAQRLVRNVTLFNVGVADRIIGGDHNHLQEVAKAQGVVVVEDQRGLPNDPDTQALIRTYHDTMATIRGGRPTTTIQIA